jgi:tetratricopeptide (TPR) repeat protein
MASLREYEALRDRGYRAMTRGELRAAAADLDAARRMADELVEDDPEIADKAEVNLAMIRVQLHEDALAERGLREVLLRTGNDDVARLAAHCLAKVLSRQSQHDKALRFATASLEKAKGLGDPLKICSALQLLGQVHVNRSSLDEALRCYGEAVAILKERPLPDPSLHAFYWCVATDMLGYVLVLLGRRDEGRKLLEQAYASSIEHGLVHLVAETAVDLSFAALQEERLDDATRYGTEALAIADAEGLEMERRNAYYLLGEAASRRGDDAAADDFFRRLAAYYPQVPFLGEFLREYDISSLVNLKEFA